MMSITRQTALKYLSPLIIALTFILCLSCHNEETIVNSPAEPTISQPVQTDDGWETASLGELGIEMTPLLQMKSYLNQQQDHNVHSILLVKDDKLVFETYYKGHAFLYYGRDYQGEDVLFDRETLQCMHSVTKSITSICIGICRDQGHLQSVDQTVFSFFPQYAYLRTPEKDQITVKNLLTMTSGLEWNEWDIGLHSSQNDIIQLNRVNDPLAFVLGKPLVDPPGTTFYYNGGTTNVLGEIVRKCSGMRLDWVSRFHLFDPLGINEFQWQYFQNGVVYASGDIYLRPRDMAKIGFLFLENGVWNGERIISEAWVNESTQTFISLPWVSWADGYGYQWWMKGYNYGVHYIPVYFHPYYQSLGYKKGECPQAEDFYHKEISIPMFPLMNDTQIDKVIELMKNIFNTS